MEDETHLQEDMRALCNLDGERVDEKNKSIFYAKEWI
jgi:hypothetical protein